MPNDIKTRRTDVRSPKRSPRALPPTARIKSAISLSSSVSYLIRSVSLSAIGNPPADYTNAHSSPSFFATPSFSSLIR